MGPATQKIGLALSGGGFRASLYHLGLVRFLRDAGLLARVSHITSVSGGSVLAAHLLLNWDRYNGSTNEFDAAASELLAFVQLDVRNRILRRFPLTILLRWSRPLLGWSRRKLSRTGLLEYHYEHFLYGDTSLFELPERPQLHILATNLSEGCLCSFTRSGLLMVRRHPGRAIRIDRVHIGLATVAMAVTASSAFPGFFPPLELTGTDVGANGGEFGRQAYTDGGVFDNLGVRMFRCLERPLLADTPLSRDDFVDVSAAVDALRQAGRSGEETPLRRVGHLLLAKEGRRPPLLLRDGSDPGNALPPSPPSGSDGHEEAVVSRLWELLSHYPLHREPLFADLRPSDPDAEALLQAGRAGGKVLEAHDQLWLNRHLLEAAYRLATGRPCFRRLNSGLDGVLVSDVGKPFEVKAGQPAGGPLRTAMRATDIVMDRVWQLEIETFHDAPGFVFAPATDVVAPADDATAPHPEIQRQVAYIRTDMDRFSPLEISSLVRHGYCVARKACRGRPDVFGTELPDNPPWDPAPNGHRAQAFVPAVAHLEAAAPRNRPRSEPAPAALDARALQASAVRRIWSTMLDYRDWLAYLYVPILVPILVLMPYIVYKSFQRSHRLGQLVNSLSQGNRDLEIMSRLLEGPIKPRPGEPAEEVPSVDALDFSGFEVLQDSRILDLRPWNPTGGGELDAKSHVYGYRRLKVVKRPDNVENSLFRVDVLATSPLTQVWFPPQQLRAHLHMSRLEGPAPGEKRCRWQASWDFAKVPAGDYVDLIYEHYSPAVFLRREDTSTSIAIPVQVDTAEATRWFLMPEGREYKSFRIVRYETGKPEKAEPVNVVAEFLAEDHTILAYKLVSVKSGYTYEVTWHYK
jgi:predicted acylesterase/phospholipase RssA